MNVRTVFRHPDRCPDCGNWMTPAVRYEESRTIDVRICWDCGAEDRPLYRRSRFERNGDPWDWITLCPHCGTSFFGPREGNGPRTYCSMACATRANAPSLRHDAGGRYSGRSA